MSSEQKTAHAVFIYFRGIDLCQILDLKLLILKIEHFIRFVNSAVMVQWLFFSIHKSFAIIRLPVMQILRVASPFNFCPAKIIMVSGPDKNTAPG